MSVAFRGEERSQEWGVQRSGAVTEWGVHMRGASTGVGRSLEWGIHRNRVFRGVGSSQELGVQMSGVYKSDAFTGVGCSHQWAFRGVVR